MTEIEVPKDIYKMLEKIAEALGCTPEEALQISLDRALKVIPKPKSTTTD